MPLREDDDSLPLLTLEEGNTGQLLFILLIIVICKVWVWEMDHDSGSTSQESV